MKLTTHLTNIPIVMLADLCGRSEQWVRKRLVLEQIASSKRHVNLSRAILFVDGLRPHDGTYRLEHAKFRISLPTLLLARQEAKRLGISLERLYYDIANMMVDSVRGLDMLSHTRPGPPARGIQVSLRHFDRYTSRCIRLIAHACRTTPSAVMDWALQFYLANKGMNLW